MCKCQCCGQLFTIDILVTDELWEKIKPEGKPEKAGLLCGHCIIRKIEELQEYAAYSLKQL